MFKKKNERKGRQYKRFVILAGLLVMSLGSVNGAPTTGKPWLDDVYLATARRYGVPVEILIAQGRQESGFRQFALSNKGAAGPAQFIPGTARRYGLRVTFDRQTDERYDFVKAIDAQGRYMRDLLARFNGRLDLALAGYNAGEGRVERLGRIPEGEPKRYVRAILANAGFGKPGPRLATANAVEKKSVVGLPRDGAAEPVRMADRSKASLFGAHGGQTGAKAVSMVFAESGGHQ